MPSRIPSTAAELIGPHLRLEPLTRSHAPALAEILRKPDVYAHGYVMHHRPTDQADALKQAESFTDAPPPNGLGHGRIPFAITLRTSVAGLEPGTFVGTSSLGDFRPTAESAHLGWTVYDPDTWSTVVNPEAKLLLLTHAFEDLGHGRVKIQTDKLNTRSQAAIAKLGATREGVLRRHVRREDGSWRDTVVFAITIDDWPTVKASLLDRIRELN